MKKTTFSIVVLFLINYVNLIAQGNTNDEYLTVIPRPSTFTNAQIKSMVEKIDRYPMAQSVTFIKFGNIKALQHRGVLNFNIPNIPQKVKARMQKVEFKNEQGFTCFAVLGDGQGEMTLISENGMTYGSLSYEGDYYRIYGLDKTMSAIVKLNKQKIGTSSIDCEEPKSSIGTNGLNTEIDILNVPNAVINPCTETSTRVLVLFTQGAQNEDPNIQQTINLSISNYNTAVASSAVNESRAFLTLAGSQLLNFTERPSQLRQDVEDLALNTNAINARNTTQADIVVLLTKQGYSNVAPTGSNAFGRVRQIHAEQDSAFAIVEVVNAVTRNTFAHEVGHLFGGGHEEPTSDPRITSYAHGRRFERKYAVFFRKRYATLMHTRPDGSNFDRVLAFSSPNATFDGVTTGDATCCNVARRMRETAPSISAYRPSPNILTGNILGADNVISHGTYSYEPELSCGSAPYAYQWEMSIDGFGFSSISSNSDGIVDLDFFPGSTISDASHITLKLTITSSDNQQITVFKTVWVSINGNPYLIEPTETDIFTAKKSDTHTLGEAYPNPANNELNFGFYIPKVSDIKISLINLVGENILTIDNDKFDMGYYRRKIDTQKITNGLYILQLSIDGNISAKKITINH